MQNAESFNNAENKPFAAPEPAPAPDIKNEDYVTPNVMQSVLSRHEQISNRIKNNRKN